MKYKTTVSTQLSQEVEVDIDLPYYCSLDGKYYEIKERSPGSVSIPFIAIVVNLRGKEDYGIPEIAFVLLNSSEVWKMQNTYLRIPMTEFVTAFYKANEHFRYMFLMGGR